MSAVCLHYDVIACLCHSIFLETTWNLSFCTEVARSVEFDRIITEKTLQIPAHSFRGFRAAALINLGMPPIDMLEDLNYPH
jgi:hypothetical protein